MKTIALAFAMATVISTVNAGEFFGKSCVKMPDGTQDCVTSTDQATFTRLKREQVTRYDKAMRAILEDGASGDKLLLQMLGELKRAEQK